MKRRLNKIKSIPEDQTARLKHKMEGSEFQLSLLFVSALRDTDRQLGQTVRARSLLFRHASGGGGGGEGARVLFMVAHVTL